MVYSTEVLIVKFGNVARSKVSLLDEYNVRFVFLEHKNKPQTLFGGVKAANIYQIEFKPQGEMCLMWDR